MSRLIFIISLFFLAYSLSAQVTKGSGIWYFDSIPNISPYLATGTELAYGIATKKMYRWDRDRSEWKQITPAVYELATLADTSTIELPMQGDIAYISADTFAVYNAAWLPFTGGEDLSSYLTATQVRQEISDSLSTVDAGAQISDSLTALTGSLTSPYIPYWDGSSFQDSRTYELNDTLIYTDFTNSSGLIYPRHIYDLPHADAYIMLTSDADDVIGKFTAGAGIFFGSNTGADWAVQTTNSGAFYIGNGNNNWDFISANTTTDELLIIQNSGPTSNDLTIEGGGNKTASLGNTNTGLMFEVENTAAANIQSFMVLSEGIMLGNTNYPLGDHQAQSNTLFTIEDFTTGAWKMPSGNNTTEEPLAGHAGAIRFDNIVTAVTVDDGTSYRELAWADEVLPWVSSLTSPNIPYWDGSAFNNTLMKWGTVWPDQLYWSDERNLGYGTGAERGIHYHQRLWNTGDYKHFIKLSQRNRTDTLFFGIDGLHNGGTGYTADIFHFDRIQGQKFELKNSGDVRSFFVIEGTSGTSGQVDLMLNFSGNYYPGISLVNSIGNTVARVNVDAWQLKQTNYQDRKNTDQYPFLDRDGSGLDYRTSHIQRINPTDVVTWSRSATNRMSFGRLADSRTVTQDPMFYYETITMDHGGLLIEPTGDLKHAWVNWNNNNSSNVGITTGTGSVTPGTYYVIGAKVVQGQVDTVRGERHPILVDTGEDAIQIGIVTSTTDLFNAIYVADAYDAETWYEFVIPQQVTGGDTSIIIEALTDGVATTFPESDVIGKVRLSSGASNILANPLKVGAAARPSYTLDVEGSLRASNYVWNTDQDTTGLDGQVMTFNSSSGELELQEAAAASLYEDDSPDLSVTLLSDYISGLESTGLSSHFSSTDSTLTYSGPDRKFLLQYTGTVKFDMASGGTWSLRFTPYINASPINRATGETYTTSSAGGLDYVSFAGSAIITLTDGDVTSLRISSMTAGSDHILQSMNLSLTEIK